MALRALLLCVAGILAPAPAGARTLLGLTAEAGPEIDTNANRIQPVFIACPAGESCTDGLCSGSGSPCVTDPESPVVSALFRLTATGRLSVRLGRHALQATYGGGGKLFMRDAARGADELVQRATASWAALLAPAAVLSVEGSYYDAYQRQTQRDFRTGAGLARLTLGRRGDGLGVTGALGYRGLQYKPFDDFSFHGPLVGMELGSVLTHERTVEVVEWELSLSYWLGVRRFVGSALAPQQNPAQPSTLVPLPTGGQREDLNHMLRVQVGYLGDAEATLWYGLELNQSSSHGESFVRQMVGLKFTTPLCWGLFLTTKGVLQLSHFREPYLISQTASFTDSFTIEDENRSRVVIQLARDLTPHVAVNLRYSLYVSESGTQTAETRSLEVGDFLRQTVFLGLRMVYGAT